MSIFKTMGANLIELAMQVYGDATGFIQLMQANPELDDWFVNQPVQAIISAPAAINTNSIVLQPTDGIELGDIIYGNGFSNYAVVTSLVQNYEDPAGDPFCNCEVAGEPMRRLPNLGKWLSTTITVAPELPAAFNVGQQVTFAKNTPVSISIAGQPATSQRGIPS